MGCREIELTLRRRDTGKPFATTLGTRFGQQRLKISN
jgi:hypothetical protein